MTGRTFLFLQGPISPFFERLAIALKGLGHEVRRINLCYGDSLLWQALPAIDYRGTMEDWPNFIAQFLERERITDLILLGDRRPIHIAAADLARQRGVRVFACELGYLRPDWITLERDGMSSYSRFPADEATIRAIADFPHTEVTSARQYGVSYVRMAVWDVVYNLANVVFSWRYPHYRWHAIYHPVAEYAGWLGRLARMPYLRRDAQRKLDRLWGGGKPYVFFPLQLETDYQLRAHSPYQQQADAIGEVFGSFAAAAPPELELLFKVHPLDNGLANWRRLIARKAATYGLADRVTVVDGGPLAPMIKNSRGVITINSTVGTAALEHGKRLYVLGSAIYAIEGLVFPGSLDQFWASDWEPRSGLYADFVTALARTIQIRGGFYNDEAINAAVEGAVSRLDRLTTNEPMAYVDPPPRLPQLGERKRRLADGASARL